MNSTFTINGVEFCVTKATIDDSASIKSLYEDTTLESKLDITFTRGDNPYKSVMSFGDKSEIYVCKNTVSKECVACIVISVYELTVNGKIENVCYINGLKIKKDYQKKYFIYLRFLSKLKDTFDNVYNFGYYNVDKVADRNKLLFEKRSNKLNFLPICEFQEEIETKIFKPYKKDTIGLIKGKINGLDEFYKNVGINYNLYPINGIKTIKDAEYLTWVKNDKIVAALALTNQEEYKGYLVRQLKGIFKILPYLPLRLFGYPKVPKNGEFVPHLNISMLGFDPNLSVKDRIKFIKAASSYGKNSNMIIIAMGKNDSSYQALRKVRGVGIPSLIYSCSYNQISYKDKPIYMDVSLL